MTKLYLASKSPRRKQLLSKLTSEFELIEVDIGENPDISEDPLEYVLRISTDKAVVARQSLPEDVPVLAADTEVVCDGRILGKPGNYDEAVDMLMSLSGGGHEVFTVVVLLTEKANHLVNLNRVWFRPLDLKECEEYCSNSQVLDKAGAYGIQDKAAAFVDRLEGSYSGVMGLPLAQTRQLLSAAGII